MAAQGAHRGRDDAGGCELWRALEHRHLGGHGQDGVHPSDPDARTQIGESWSPWENTDATLPWPCTRLVETALSKRCAFARYWQDTRASTSERYDLVTIPPDTLKTPDVKQQFPSLTTFRTWPLRMVRTATETRA